MLISEVRSALGQYKPDDLKRLAVALYQAMPAKVRTEKNVDAMVKDFMAFEATKKERAQGSEVVDVKALSTEITQFIDYAYAQYFLAPNTFVRKSERPKWRFRVKDYVKQLTSLVPETEDGKTATELLVKLYTMLSYACAYYLFNTDSPFRSVGIQQVDFLDLIVVRVLATGVNAANLSTLILLIVDGTADRETLNSYLINVLSNHVRTTDGRETVIAQSKRIYEEKAAAAKPVGKRSSTYSDMDVYRKENALDDLVEITFFFYCELYEFDSGIDYFHRHTRESSPEHSLYVLLSRLESRQQPALWIREYERAQKFNVKPRERLKAVYHQLKETGRFDGDDV